MSKRIRRIAAARLLAAAALWAQGPDNSGPNAQNVKTELSLILDRCPPTLRGVLALDPSLLSNQSYLAPYPALSAYLNAHPEIAHNPSFYIGSPDNQRPDHATQVMDMWRDAEDGLAVFTGIGLAISLLVWLIRTLVDYRRWSRLAKVQTDVHTQLRDRFSSNDDLLNYVQSPAGAKFLESAPIMLDAAPRSVGAPLGRILWSIQGGVVLIAGGTGLKLVSGSVSVDAAVPINVLGVVAIALGIGFAISAIISFAIARRMGLIEPLQKPQESRANP